MIALIRGVKNQTIGRRKAMSSGKALTALGLLIFTLCAVVGFLAFALNTLSVGSDLFSGIVLPQLETVVLYAVSFTLAVILSQVFSIRFVKVSQNFVFKIFDRQWLPKEGKAETYTTEYGERLEKVVSQSYTGTVVWELVTQTIPTVFLLSFVFGVLAVIVAFAVNLSLPLVGLGTVFMVNVVLFSWEYWVKQWRRKYSKLIIFTSQVGYLRVRTPLLSLLFGIGNLPRVSWTPVSEINDDQIAADPQDFDPKYKTSWLRDQYTSFLSKKNNIRTIFLRSKSNEAEDTVLWIDHGPGIEKILKSLKRRSTQLLTEQSYIDRAALRMRLGGTAEEDWSRIRADEEARLFQERFREISIAPKTHDLYRIEDPGLYDNDGNLIEKTSVEANAGRGDYDVSHFFSSPSRRLNDYDATEEQNPDQDKIP
ncbi:MAG: hypothetical protein ACD_25C00078G0003 [uncultured bacterium]|uniref:Uncharacterized protein n=1 Tax=candidate division WWE3 bacterium TaxID=2053526 RepID=A0A656PLB4_UNCKA|nr:hypothetical protein P147_WWE3C00001G0246 [candidate division WWE3 bacterium RAAC2_WWE3_1]EKD95071.1 MAG: hypothetical protein ACD_25C00078G0003 [uncultured bacterium]KKT05899.1 MAG: hypothetical protein UV83_C0001G0217 [candidate division WWE3 bacterium GW2011_GWE2_43_18]KKT07211.1 MAG: hypothetical protein UV84_C0001G0047 [candidate division WWE3 bacterium GW2011_GWF2_43_18]KKT65086.1 MAG: hypothetical protein UW59_C0002G0079 [candidate division WWE3 bacterium GW2011_GWC1_44_308]KKT71107.